MNDRLFALRLFSRVARTGSFSAAGRELGLSQPSVSRIIAELERDVGAGLMTRTTRAVALTEAGADYLGRIEPILAELDEADHAARGTGELRGRLRIGASSSFASREVIPVLPAFADRHPALGIELILDDARQDLVAEGVDVALRFGPLADSSARARRIGVARRVLVASPAYLARAGAPASPVELPAHRIVFAPPSRSAGAWTFRKDGKVTSVRVEPQLTVSTNEGAVAAAVAGMGIFSTGNLGCRRELEAGELARVLPDWDMGGAEIHAIYVAGLGARPAARAFTDFLIEALKPSLAAAAPDVPA